MKTPHHPLENLAPDASETLERAYAAMRASYCGRISTLHLLLAVLDDEKVAGELEKLGFDVEKGKSEARTLISQDNELATSEKRFSNGAKRALERAKTQANARGRTQIGALEVFGGLLSRDATWKENRIFGKIEDDEAARVLAGVDAKKWGEILGPSFEKSSESYLFSRLLRLLSLLIEVFFWFLMPIAYGCLFWWWPGIWIEPTKIFYGGILIIFCVALLISVWRRKSAFDRITSTLAGCSVAMFLFQT